MSNRHTLLLLKKKEEEEKDEEEEEEGDLYSAPSTMITMCFTNYVCMFRNK